MVPGRTNLNTGYITLILVEPIKHRIYNTYTTVKPHLSLRLRSMNYYIHTIIITCIKWLLASVLFYWMGVKNKSTCY